MGHRAVKRLLLTRVLPVVILPVILKVAVEVRGFFIAVSGVTSTSTPFRTLIPLSHGAQLVAKGVTQCGGIQGDCMTSAQLRIQWRGGTIEIVENKALFEEAELDSARLSLLANRWKLQIGERTWTRLRKLPQWQ